MGSGSGEGMLSTGGYMRAFLRSVVGVDARTATMRGEVFQLPPLPLSAAPSVHDER